MCALAGGARGGSIGRAAIVTRTVVHNMRWLVLPVGLFLATADVAGSGSYSGSEDGRCGSDIDCQLNGVCEGGKCLCDAAWSGNANCSTLALLPAKMKNGYGYPGSPVSSWGAGVQQDPATKKWIMAVSDYALSCGQGAFPPNQQCGLAVANSPDGPFTKNRAMIDPYCEGSSISRDPISGRWLYLHGGHGVAGGHSAAHPAKSDLCWNCSGAGGVTPRRVQSTFRTQNNATPLVGCPRTSGTYDAPAATTADGPEVALVSTTADPLGAWALAPAVACGSNNEPWFTPNGTLYVVRPGGGQLLTPAAKARCSGGSRAALLGLARAESLAAGLAGDWQQIPVRYALAGTNQSFADDLDVCFNWEDQVSLVAALPCPAPPGCPGLLRLADVMVPAAMHPSFACLG
jgi:hypothetical protein